MARKKSVGSSKSSASSKSAARGQQAARGELSRALAQIKALQKQVKILQKAQVKASSSPKPRKARQTLPKAVQPRRAAPTAGQSARAVNALISAAAAPVRSALAVVASVARFVLQDSRRRTYLDTTTGETITRRQRVIRQTGRNPEQLRRDNLYQLSQGRSTVEGRDRYRQVRDKRGRRAAFQQAYRRAEAARLGIKPAQVRVRGDSEQARTFREAMREIERLRPKVRDGGGSKADNHAYLQALHALGVISEAAARDWRKWSGS